MKNRARSFQAKLFLAFTLVIMLTALLPALFTRGTLYEERLELARQQALAEATFVRGIFEARPDTVQVERLFQAFNEQGRRVTRTDARGRVMNDSDVPAERLHLLDNHNDRPEIEAALSRGQGFSLRHSNSLGIDAVYAAVRLADGGAVRVAVPLADIEQSLKEELASMGLIMGAVALLCLALSAVITRKVRLGISQLAAVVESISLGKGRRVHGVPGREFQPLADAVNRMADTIERSVRTLSAQQAQLETILNSIHEGVLVLAPDGTILRWNRALEGLFPGMADALGKSLIEQLPVPMLQERADALLRGGPSEGALPFEQPSGRFLVAHMNRPADASLGAVIVFYDATELTRLERVRRDFVANVSHELRTPLTAIAASAETLLELGGEDDGRARFARIILKHAGGLSRMVGDLLALARIEDNREAITLEAVEPAAALEDAVAMCRPLFTAKDISIRTELERGAVRGNAALLAQVFRNLLENAVRYSPEGGEVRVTGTAGHAPGGSFMRLTVSDDGPGIPPDERERVFERFYQVEKQRTNMTAGLGLAICKHIIERHGGSIRAESPAGGTGTSVVFTLPLEQEQ